MVYVIERNINKIGKQVDKPEPPKKYGVIICSEFNKLAESHLFILTYYFNYKDSDALKILEEASRNIHGVTIFKGSQEVSEAKAYIANKVAHKLSETYPAFKLAKYFVRPV